MVKHRCCTALFLCSSTPLTLAYVALAGGSGLILSGLLNGVDPARSPLDRLVAVVMCASMAPLGMIGMLSTCAACGAAQGGGRCRKARVLAVHGSLTAVIFAVAVCVAVMVVVVSLSGNDVFGGVGDGTVLGYILDSGCQTADRTCCQKYAKAFVCMPLHTACEAQQAANSTVTLRDIFVSAAEDSQVFLWVGSGVVTLGLLLVVITSFGLCVAIQRDKKDEEFANDKEMYIVDAFRWDSRGMNNGKGEKEPKVWVIDNYRVETWPRGI